MLKHCKKSNEKRKTKDLELENKIKEMEEEYKYFTFIVPYT